MPICAACGLEVARCGFTKAQLGKKDGRRCKQCLTTPESPGTAIVSLDGGLTEPLEDLEAALQVETKAGRAWVPAPWSEASSSASS